MGDLLTQHFIIIAQILEMVAVVMGAAMMVGAFFQLKRYGEMRSMMSHQMSIAGPLAMLLAGSLLLSLPTFMKFSLLAFMGSANPMSLSPVTGYDITPLLVFVRVVGIGSFMRGLVLLSRAGHQQGDGGHRGDR